MNTYFFIALVADKIEKKWKMEKGKAGLMPNGGIGGVNGLNLTLVRIIAQTRVICAQMTLLLRDYFFK